MSNSLNARLASMSRSELIAGIGVALIVSGIALRFLGSTVVLAAVRLLRSMSDQAITLIIHAFGLSEILLGIALLVWVARNVRKRTRTTVQIESGTSHP